MIDEIVNVNEKQEFYLNNLILKDSARVNFTLIEDDKLITDVGLYAQLLNNNGTYNKTFLPPLCKYTTDKTTLSEFDLPETEPEAKILKEIY